MENAQLISLSRQVALQRQMDVVANNIANINTTGFKSEAMLFEEYQMPAAKDRDFAYPDQPLSYVEDWATIHDLSGGAIEQTGNPLDVALQGDGFLTVQTPSGPQYTKSGDLKIDASGTLVTNDGYPVLSDGGPVKFTGDEKDITISQNGAIASSAGGKGKLSIVEFANPQQLAREGNNLFSGGTPQPATNTRIVQGAIERSNVSGVTEMAEMIRVQRSYQTLTTLMQQQQDMRGQAIKRLGDLSA